MDEKRMVKLLWIVKAGLLAVLAYAAFDVVVSRLHLGVVLDPRTVSGEPRATETPAALPENHSPSDYAAIAQSNLFTKPDNTKAAPAGTILPQSLEPAAAEELGLTLIGSAAGGPTSSRAIIQDTRTNSTDVYGIGDTVAAAVVENIQREAVVLRYQGKALVLKQCSGKADAKTAKAPAGPPRTESAPPAVASRAPTASPAAADPSRSGYMAQMFRQATIEPYVKNNRTEGLRITGLENIPMADMLGFKNGDVVQSINGQQLTSKQKAFQVLMKARTQPQVDIQLLRDGQSKALSFNL